MAFLSGIISGIMTGFGMGGGTMLIAILTYVTAYSQVELQSINLIYFIPVSLFALLVYIKNKEIDYKISLKIVAWGIVPAIICAIIANRIDVSFLRKLFAVYLIIVGIVMIKQSGK